MSESGRFPCPKDCGYAYEPVCGFNPCEEEHPNHMFRTFHNKCELENTICDGPGHCKYCRFLCVWRVVLGNYVMYGLPFVPLLIKMEKQEKNGDKEQENQ